MSGQANMDFIGKGGNIGEVAAYMASRGRMDPGMLRPFLGDDGRVYVTVYSGGDPKKPESYRDIPLQVNAYNPLQVNSTLRPYEWRQLDQVVQQISRARLGGVQDLIDNNLTYNLGNAMGTTVLEYHDVSDAMDAELTMDGVSRSKADRPDFQPKYLPIPILHSDFEINARALAASRNMGNPLDTTMVEMGTRKILEKREKMLFTNETYGFGGGTIYSYLNHPNRAKVTLHAHWNDSAASADDIINDVLAMKQASIDAKHFGPWMLYVPSNFETVLDQDYNTTSGKTIRERILGIAGIKGVKVVDYLTADNVLLVQMSADVVRLVNGMGIQVVQWDIEGKFLSKFKIVAIQVPQVRSDQDGNCGVVHGSK